MDMDFFVHSNLAGSPWIPRILPKRCESQPNVARANGGEFSHSQSWPTTESYTSYCARVWVVLFSHCWSSWYIVHLVFLGNLKCLGNEGCAEDSSKGCLCGHPSIAQLTATSPENAICRDFSRWKRSRH